MPSETLKAALEREAHPKRDWFLEKLTGGTEDLTKSQITELLRNCPPPAADVNPRKSLREFCEARIEEGIDPLPWEDVCKEEEKREKKYCSIW
jgi:hypothetical protein